MISETNNAVAVALGGVTQMRILGGAIGVAIATSLLSNTVISALANVLPAEIVNRLLQNISSVALLSPRDQVAVQAAFALGYKKQLAMILGFCAAEVLAIGLMWESKPRRLAQGINLMNTRLANDEIEEEKTN